MKSRKLFYCTLGAAAMASFSLVGCENDDVYKVGAPSNLQALIDEAAAKAAAANKRGESAEGPYRIGELDYSTAYWSVFSKYYTVGRADTLNIVFANSNGKSSNNYNNWVMGITNNADIMSGEGYVEYYVPRADRWDNLNDARGVNTPYDGSVASLDSDDAWKKWRADMDGATVTVQVIRDEKGVMTLNTTAVATDGKTKHTMSTTSNAEVGAAIPDQDSIRVFFSVDHCYLNFSYSNKEGKLDPKSVVITGDVAPVSMKITDAPETVEIGNDNFWGKAKATVTFENGQTIVADSADLTFTVVPDMKELGKKVVVATYNKTMQGVFCVPVTAYYTLEVVNPIVKIAAKYNGSALYFADGCASVVASASDFEVTGTYSDDATVVLKTDEFTLSALEAKAGTQKVTVSYKGMSSVLTDEVDVEVKSVSGSGMMVGLEDMSTPWWAHFTPDWKVASGAESSVELTCNSLCTNNWCSPCVILRSSLKAEYIVVRMDNFGWGDGWDAAVKECDWNWDTYQAGQNKARVVVTVKNVGDGTAVVRYDVTHENGDKFFQQYSNIAVNADDLNFALVCEGSNMLFD